MRIPVLKPAIDNWPGSLLILKVAGPFWLVRIGWRMASSTLVSGAQNEERPMRFFAALLLQFANPKAITATVALAALVRQTLPSSAGLLRSATDRTCA
jgi:threonine/homoserine/homoserine lactone efflux protein